MPRGLIYAVIALLTGVGAGYLLGRHGTEDKSARRVDLSVVDGGIYRVRKVIDGDTIVLENGLHVRYNGMNAPETGHFVHDVAPIAAEATQRNIALVEDKRVRIRLGRDPLDIHGRLIAHVMILPEENPDFKEETDAGFVLVREGLARTMGVGISKDENDAVKKLEDAAKAAKLGIWGLEEHIRKTGAKPYCATSYSNSPVDDHKIYHLITCPLALRIKAANRHEYASIEEAEAAGLRPHSCVAK